MQIHTSGVRNIVMSEIYEPSAMISDIYYHWFPLPVKKSFPQISASTADWRNMWIEKFDTCLLYREILKYLSYLFAAPLDKISPPTRPFHFCYLVGNVFYFFQWQFAISLCSHRNTNYKWNRTILCPLIFNSVLYQYRWVFSVLHNMVILIYLCIYGS